jgi:hypothetical protein
VDGYYHFSGFKNNAGMFSRKDVIENKEITFIIYRNTSGRWAISQEGFSSFFYYQDSENSTVPVPCEGGTTCNFGNLPSPFLTIIPNYCEFSEDEADNHLSDNPDGYTAFYRNESMKDCTISYDGTIFKAHKAFLASVSLYFQRMFSGQWKETSSCSIQPLSDINSHDFRAFLKYIYTKVPKLLVNHAWSIWELCDYFEVLSSFKTEVLHHLIKIITVTGANRYIPLINQNAFYLGQQPSSVLTKDIHQKFVEFVANNSKSLVKAGFRFRELEESVLNAIFEMEPNKK